MAVTNGSEHLIVQTAFLGDLLLGIPLLKEFRVLKPNDKITLLCRQGLGDFIRRTGLVDEVIEADKSSSESWSKAVDVLRVRKFDWILCPHESPRSAFLVWKLSANHKVGYSRGWSFFVFNHRVQRPMDLPEPIRQLALLQPLKPSLSKMIADYSRTQTAPGGQGVGGELLEVPTWASMDLSLLKRLRSDFRQSKSLSNFSDRSRTLANELSFTSHGKKIAILAPGSVWRTKMWTAGGYADAARSLIADGWQVIVSGAPDEKEVCERVAADAVGAISIAGRTSLFESAEIIACADLVLCNDSGAMHIASAAGVPLVSVFGPTVLEFGYRPWQNNAKVVEVPKVDLRCRPCGKHGAQACPIGTHECMTRIQATQVLNASRLIKISEN